MTKNNHDPVLSSYCGWFGSKSPQAENILIPRLHPIAYQSYAELFAGGSAGLFLKKQKAKVQNILNDKDPDVVNMHSCVAGQPDAVMEAMQRLRPSRLTFDDIKRQRDSAQWWDLPDVERAARLLYLVKNSINSKMTSFSMSAKAAAKYNPWFDLHPFADKLAGVLFESLDWRELLERLVFKPREARLFLYCDPPYVIATQSGHYRFNFDYLEHVLFARTLCRINELNERGTHDVRVMVSYDDDEKGLIRSLYRPEFGWRIEAVQVKSSAGNQGSSSQELVITNYDTAGIVVPPSPTPAVDCSDIRDRCELPSPSVHLKGRQ